MSDDRKKVDVSGIALPFWMMGWLFTVGYLHLPFAKGFLAIFIWPYYLGVKFG